MAADWPESWRYSYAYDLMEIWGDRSNPGYAYAYDNRLRETLRLVGSVAKPGDRILDIAAAQGNFTLALAEAGYDVTWNDLRADLAGYVQIKHEHGRVHYAPGNAFELALEGCFDVVLIAEVIEHVAHPDQFLANIARLVKPGGHVVMTTPNGAYFQNRLPKFSDCPDPERFEAVQFGPDGEDHIFLLHPDEVPALASAAGLVVQATELLTNPLTNGFARTAPLLKILPEAAVTSVERCTRRLPSALASRLHTAMAVLLQKPAE